MVTKAPFVPARRPLPAPKLAGPSKDQDKMIAALTGSAAPVSVGMSGFNLAKAQIDSGNYVVGQVYSIPVVKLQKSENNARAFYDPQELDEMSTSLSTKGQDVPAIGYVKDGRIVLTDGQKRMQAAISAGLEFLDVRISETPPSGKDEYETSRRVNIERSAQTAIDDAVRWKEMLERGEYASQDEIAERLGLKKAAVSKTMQINRIPHRLLRVMSDHEKTRQQSIAYAISSIFEEKRLEALGAEKAEEIAEEVIRDVAGGDYSRNEVEALINSRLAATNHESEKKRRERADASAVRYGEAKGVLKVFPARGQLQLSFTGLGSEKVTELKKKIEEVLGAGGT